ncbi:glutamate racemase, partial [Bacteroidota bacterium]
ILELDNYNNDNHSPGADGIPDFSSEKFIYLADEANMPYGRYDSEGKADFLRELVIKDALFLMDNQYYNSPDDSIPINKKEPVKAIVVACNTATAYGLETLKDIMEEIGFDIPVMGIIDAGSRDALKLLKQSDHKKTIIGIMATEGTCSSGGYPNAILQYKDKILGENEIKIVQQAGVGLAGAIDGDKNYIDPKASGVRDPENYKGPGINNPDFPVDTTYWTEYNFSADSDLLIEENDNGTIFTNCAPEFTLLFNLILSEAISITRLHILF